MATTRRVPFLLVVPTVVILVVALGYPVGWQIVTSFQEFGLAQQFGQPPEWVGIENYRALVNDPALWAVIVRSIVFCIVCALTTVVLGVAIACSCAASAAPHGSSCRSRCSSRGRCRSSPR